MKIINKRLFWSIVFSFVCLFLFNLANADAICSSQDCIANVSVIITDEYPNITLNSPSDNATDQNTTVILNITVTDAQNDTMEVTFYNDDTGISICINNSVSNGSQVTCSWSTLNLSSTYNWYAVADDGTYETQSDVWHFTTKNISMTADVNISQAGIQTTRNVSGSAGDTVNYTINISNTGVYNITDINLSAESPINATFNDSDFNLTVGNNILVLVTIHYDSDTQYLNKDINITGISEGETVVVNTILNLKLISGEIPISGGTGIPNEYAIGINETVNESVFMQALYKIGYPISPAEPYTMGGLTVLLLTGIAYWGYDNWEKEQGKKKKKKKKLRKVIKKYATE